MANEISKGAPYREKTSKQQQHDAFLLKLIASIAAKAEPKVVDLFQLENLMHETVLDRLEVKFGLDYKIIDSSEPNPLAEPAKTAFVQVIAKHPALLSEYASYFQLNRFDHKPNQFIFSDLILTAAYDAPKILSALSVENVLSDNG